MPIKIVAMIVVAGLACQMVACGAMFNGGGRKISVNSNPPGAKIFVDGVNYGTTPARIKVDRKDSHIVKLSYNGRESTHPIESKLGAGWVVLDVLGGLVPVVVDAATGSWYSVSPKKINADLN